MVTIICQHSGLEFEAETKRTKQHPGIAAFKAKADKNGTYRDANNALAEAKKRGSYTTVDEYMTLVDAIMAEYKDHAKARDAKRAEAERKAEVEREQYKAERQAINDKLKAAGYRWSHYEPREDMGQDDGYARWDLFSPDGRIVEVDQALDEIARGADVAQAEIAAKLAEKKANEAAAEKADREAIDAFDARIDEIKSKSKRIERIEFTVTDTIRIEWPAGRKHSYYRHIDKIQHGQVNGVDCWRIVIGSGYDDDGYDSYYCANPSNIGAATVRVTESNDNSFF